MIKSHDFERQVDDIELNVPWGHISCKWWGPKIVRPIVWLHGWQDNCQSFDPLIYQLPDHLSYLAVDLPGHGFSSRLPNGMIYTLEIYFYSLILICDHFQWEEVSLMGHSLGSIMSFMYAAAFPNKCDMVIGLDTLKPYNDKFDLIYQHFTEGLGKSLAADIRNRENVEPPSYTYDELLTKIKSGFFMKINDQSAPYLLQRAVLPSNSEPNKYYFSRDSRTKASPIPMLGHDIVTNFARKIVSPYCFIKTTTNRKFECEKYYNEIVEIMSKKSYFEIHLVEGDHHVHLNEPSNVRGLITKFINKYRPKHVPVNYDIIFFTSVSM